MRLGVIVGSVLLALLVGKLMGPETYELIVTILKAVGLVLLGITVLVTIHELGHFLTAKMFGMRVEAFSIGFPPKLFSVIRGDTEYQIGATPLGGYVKISGIIDESMDTQHINEAPQSYEFRAKPVWQRLIVMTGGVIMNVILGVFIFSFLAFKYGEERTPVEELEYGIAVREEIKSENKCGEIVEKVTLGQMLGFRSGDQLYSFKGKPLPYVEDYLKPNLLLDNNAYYEVKRNNETVRIDVPSNILNQFNNDTVELYLFEKYNYPAKIKLTSEDSLISTMNVSQSWPADKAGLQTGDIIVKLDDRPVNYYVDLLQYIPQYKNKAVDVTVMREDSLYALTVQMDTTGKMGIMPHPDMYEHIKTENKDYNFVESIQSGYGRAFGILSVNAKGFGQIVSGNANAGSSVMGPLAIAQQYLEIFTSGGWRGFWILTASLSMILAFVNILPIPALDGGHVVFLLIEAITRREPSPKIRIIAQQIGMFIILGLMVLVIFNDFFNHILGGC